MVMGWWGWDGGDGDGMIGLVMGWWGWWWGWWQRWFINRNYGPEVFFPNKLSGQLKIYCCFLVAKPDFLWAHGLEHVRHLCLSLSPAICSDSCPLSQWSYLTISSSATPYSFCLQSFPPSGSFPMSRLFASGGRGIGAPTSASVLPVNIQDWFSLWLTGLLSLQSKGLSRVFSSTTN